MAYCVHCGVKLEKSQQRCPLCGTLVLYPSEATAASLPSRSYPGRSPEQELRRSKRFLLSVLSLLLLAPAALCLMIDCLTPGPIGWSLYVFSALTLLFVSVAVPILMDTMRVYWSLLVPFLCLDVFLYLVERLSGSGPWFFPIAMPALLLFALMLGILVYFFRSGRLTKLPLAAGLLAAAAVECLAIEWLCCLHTGARDFIWSPFVMAPCLLLSLGLFFINSNRSVREELERRVHF